MKKALLIQSVQSRRRQNQDFQALRSRMMKLQKHFDAVVGYS